LRKFSKKNIKVGILGGTFDPPHIGHLHISKIALKKLKLNKLIWVITKKNPLKKKPYLKIKTRIKLSKKITNKEKKIFVRCFDDKIKYINTFDLLNHIKRKQKKTKLYFLIGADNLIKFHKWKNWKKIPKLAKIVVFPRDNHLIRKNKYIVLKTLKKKDLIYINSKKANISSSLIRKFW
jgi:nicotinate-nucleotide adenylyltransferase